MTDDLRVGDAEWVKLDQRRRELQERKDQGKITEAERYELQAIGRARAAAVGRYIQGDAKLSKVLMGAQQNSS